MFKKLIGKINNHPEKTNRSISKLTLDNPVYYDINVGEIDASKIVNIDGLFYHKDDLTTKREGVFDVLDGFKAIEVLEQDQDILITKFENEKGDEKVVTQTENEINIRWDE